MEIQILPVDGLSSSEGIIIYENSSTFIVFAANKRKNLIDRTQAADYLDKEINATNIDGKSIQITDISLVYAVDELSSEGIQCSPYWRFGFQKRKNSESVWLYKDLNEYDTYSDTEDGKHQENGYFLINAVDGSIMY